ncbi:MAG: hypothetical protein ABFD90_21035 [Phycisphaerales bacterium]
MVVLACESILGILAWKTGGTAQMLLVIGMILVLLSLIAVAAAIVIGGPRAAESDSRNDSDTPRTTDDFLRRHTDCVSTFRSAQKTFLQVLLNRFELHRLQDGAGTRLIVRIDENDLAIWSGEGKRVLNRWVFPRAQEEVINLQRKLECFLLEGQGDDWNVEAKDVRFRFASGGTLPILHIGDHAYYCLFYREIRPIGWNIANGSCDTREELLQPRLAMKRELSEELIIIDPTREKGHRYVFDDYHDAAEFTISHELIHRLFPELTFDSLSRHPVKVTPEPGPDEVSVTIGRNKAKWTHDCFLNINATDLGIEIDQIVTIEVDPTARLLDGELADSVVSASKGDTRLVNAPVGLFSVEKMNESLRSRVNLFVPDILFHSARQYGNVEAPLNEGSLDTVTGEFAKSKWVDFDRDEQVHYRDIQDRGLEYDLCPVTRSIITRFISTNLGK